MRAFICAFNLCGGGAYRSKVQINWAASTRPDLVESLKVQLCLQLGGFMVRILGALLDRSETTY